MARKTNVTINGKDYYRIYRKIGMKRNAEGLWVPDYKNFYGSCKSDAEEQYKRFMERKGQGDVNTKCLGELIDEWIDAVFDSCSLSDNTKQLYKSAYERIMQNDPIAGRRPEEVSALDLQQFYNAKATGAGGNIKALNGLLRRFYRYADINGLCKDITHAVTVPHIQAHTKKANSVEVFEDEEVKKIIAALKGTTLRFLIVLAVNTGARFSELLALTYDDITDGQLIINKQLTEAKNADGVSIPHIDKTKTASSNRVIPLSKAVLQELKTHRAIHEKEQRKNKYTSSNIFTSAAGTYYYRRNIVARLKRLYDSIGVPYHNFHCYRHTFGSNLSRAGVPIEETAKLMGHTNIQVTAQYYINVSDKRKQSAINKIAKYTL